MRYPNLRQYPVIGGDTETTGLKWWEDRIFGVSISAPDGQDWYWDVRKDPGAIEFLQEELPQVPKIVFHHAKFDWHMLREAGVRLRDDQVECTMIRAALIDEHLLTYDLDALGKKYIGIGKDSDIWPELAAIFGGRPTKNSQAPNLQRAPKELVGKYAKQDSRTCFGLWAWQEGEIEKQDLGRVWDLERRLLPAIVRMEQVGVRVDVEKAFEAAKTIERKAKTLQYQLNNLAGFEINPNPSGSIHDLFQPKKDEQGRWVLRDGTIAPKTPAGKASIDADTLRAMKDPLAGMILDLRKMLKTKGTFLEGHILGHHHNGIVHANINQTKTDDDVGTGTGRLSINDPALQQIHKRDILIAPIVRGVFIPADECDWVCNDWAQMDFRMFAHYVNNKKIIKMYEDDPDTDFHKLAAGLTGLPRSPRFSGDPNAKQINLGLVFGMGQGKLASEMGLPFTEEKWYSGRNCPECAAKTCTNIDHVRQFLKPGPEAESVFERYHGAIPGVRDMLRNATSVARSRGYVKTAMGRKIRFPRGMFTHKAGGLIFQGTAADALKIKIIELDEYFRENPGSGDLTLNVHDEFDCQIPQGMTHVHADISRIVTTFDGEKTPIKFRVPIRTEQGIGPNWWEASK